MQREIHRLGADCHFVGASAICFFFFVLHKYLTGAQKVAICWEQVTGISTCIAVHNSSPRMLLFPVMVVSLVILGPGESSWSWIIGTGTSYLQTKIQTQDSLGTVCWQCSVPHTVFGSTNWDFPVWKIYCWQIDVGVANNSGALQHSVYTSSLRNSTHLQIVNEGSGWYSVTIQHEAGSIQ